MSQPGNASAARNASPKTSRTDADQRVGLLDELVGAAGTYFTSLTTVAGYATKAALPLARLYGTSLHPRIGGSFLDLLAGLGDGPLPADGHLVSSLDWFVSPKAAAVIDRAAAEEARFRAARAMRLDAEARARGALAGEPRQHARFERLLAAAQRFDRVRESRPGNSPWPGR